MARRLCLVTGSQGNRPFILRPATAGPIRRPPAGRAVRPGALLSEEIRGRRHSLESYNSCSGSGTSNSGHVASAGAEADRHPLRAVALVDRDELAADQQPGLDAGWQGVAALRLEA